LTVDAWEDVKSELLWSFNNDMLARWIPADHVVIFGAFEKAWELFERDQSGGEGERPLALTHTVSLGR
jgi:hypothetical protein